MKLIHFELGRYNGMAYYQLGNKLFKFELCTPNFNDYGEYRVEIEDFNGFEFSSPSEVFKHPEHLVVYEHEFSNIELTSEEVEWWNDPLESRSIEEYMTEYICGGNHEEEGVVIMFGSRMVKFEDWLLEDQNPFDKVVFRIFKLFFDYYNSDDAKLVSNDILIFP